MRVLAFLSLLFTPAALAQSVHTCGTAAQTMALDIRSFVDTRSFANGDVRLYFMDTIEPAAAALNLVVIHPPYAEDFPVPMCHVIGPFAGLDWEGLEAGYDPEVGLVFDFTAQVYNVETALFDEVEAQVTVNQASGLVTLTP